MPVEMPDVDTEEEEETPEQPDLKEMAESGALGNAYADDTDVVSSAAPEAVVTDAASGATAPEAAAPEEPEVDAAPATDTTPTPGAPGGAYTDPQDTSSHSTSDAAQSLGEFAAATGTTAAAPQTHLDQVGPPPTPPTMDTNYAQTQADLRAKSVVTPKVDANGQTLAQYKPSIGARIGRAFLDAGRGFLSHGLAGAISAPLEGAFGNRNAPGYYGRGAVNGQYNQDEAARQRDVAADTAQIGSYEDQQKQAQTQFKDQNDVYKDSLGQAYKQDVNDIKDQTAAEKARHDEATETLKKQLQDATNPQAKADAELKVRTNIAEKIGLTGREKQLYQANGKMPDDDTIQRRLKVEEGRFGLEQAREARESGTTGGQWYTSTKELSDYKDRTGSLDREASSLESRKALYTEGGTADKESQAALGRINDRLDAIDKQKDTIKQGIISNRPAKSSAAPSSGSTPPADTSDIPAAEFNPRTGEPTAGITATNPDGTPGKAVVSGKKDASGRPTIEIQQPPAAAPQLTPVPDKTVKTKGGRVLNVGDNIPGHGTIKGFGKDAAGKINAMF
jgi:hypothetical protein